MKKTLLAAIFLLAPSLATAQYDGGYTDRPTLTVQSTDPSGSCTGAKFWINSTTGDAFACYNNVWNAFGGGASFPLLAGTGCANPPYGFTSGTGGLCSLSSSGMVLQSSATSNNRSVFSTDDDIATIESFSPAGVLDSRLSVLDGGFEFEGGATFAQRFRVAQTVLDVDLAAGGHFSFDIINPATTTDVALSLRDIGTNTFLSFTNVATPAKAISFAQDSSTPTLTIVTTDGTATATQIQETFGWDMTVTDGVGTSSLTVSDDQAYISGSKGSSAGSYAMNLNTPSITISVNDGVDSGSVSVSPGGISLNADGIELIHTSSLTSIQSGKIRVTGTSPSSPACTGIDTGSTALDSSDDHSGTFVLSPTGTPGSSGTCTATFSSAYASTPVCIATAENVSGSVWAQQVAIRIATAITSTVLGIAWENDGTALTAGGTYRINYVCFAR